MVCFVQVVAIFESVDVVYTYNRLYVKKSKKLSHEVFVLVDYLIV